MIVKDLLGRECRMPTKPYLIDWDRAVSGPQKMVKDFLRPYWERDLVLEEARIPHCLLRLDLMNATRGIVVEVSPVSTHGELNEFMHGSFSGWQKRLKSDMAKEEWAALNGFTFVELTDPELANLSPALFEERWGVTL